MLDALPSWLAEALRRFRDQLAREHGRARRRLRGAAGLDLLAWGRRYLPEHFTCPASRMHQWLAERLDRLSDERGVKINVLGPRGGAKSTVGTLAFVLRAAVEGREPYIWIVSDTRHQAHAHLANIKAELEDNAGLAADYPTAVGRGPVWRAGAIVLGNGAAIEAYGTGQRLRGRRRREHRPTLIVCDDLQNDGHTQSALLRQRSREWFHGTLLKAGTSETNLLNLATALHTEALAVELDRTPGWTSRVFRAIQRWPTNMALWEAWEALYCDAENAQAADAARRYYERNRQAMDAGAVLLWPEREDLYALMRMRAESGRTAFEREKQNSPINPELCEWPERYFEDLWFDDWPELQARAAALDPSKGSDSRRGDYSALVLLGVDRRGMLFVEADLARRATSQMVADAVERCRRFQPDAFGIEANQFQELLAPEFEAEFQRQGMLGVRPWLIDNRVNKLVRIRRLGPYLASRRMRFRDTPGTRLLVDQLRQFPAADHDDGPDALEMALRLAADLVAGCDDGLGDRLI